MLLWNCLPFPMIQQMLAIWSLVPLPFLNPTRTSQSSQLTYCWSLAWRILNITLLACEVSAIVRFEHSLALPIIPNLITVSASPRSGILSQPVWNFLSNTSEVICMIYPCSYPKGSWPCLKQCFLLFMTTCPTHFCLQKISILYSSLGATFYLPDSWTV